MSITALNTLTNLELLRQARSSPLMDDPLFAELVTRLEEETAYDNRMELDARVYGSVSKPARASNPFSHFTRKVP